MCRRTWPVLTASLSLLLASCSDNDPPPQPPAELGPRDGGAGDRRGEKGWPWDGFDPKCPSGDPCVYETRGEGKHGEDYVVIGERLTLTGKGLGDVDTVYLGAAIAPLISASPTQVVCRVGPGTPSGEQSVEVVAGTAHRKYTRITVRRLVLPLAADHPQVTSWDALTHAGGPDLDLGQTASATPIVSVTGRYLAVPTGTGKLTVVDLPREAVAGVSGLPPEAISSLSGDPEDRALVVTTAGGKLFTVELGAFPSLSAVAASGVPAAVAVTRAGTGAGARFVGLHPSAGAGEGSVWHAASDLKSASYAQLAGKPFLVGGGAGLQPLALTAHDDAVALLALDGGAPQLGLLVATAGSVSGVATVAAPGALSLAIAAGGKLVALGSDAASPALSYSSTGAAGLKQVSLGGSGAQRVLPLRVPTRAGVVAVLVGPKPSGSFEAGAVELCDLGSGSRITSTGGKPALELAGIRAAVADTAVDLLHLLVAGDYRSYAFSINGSSVTLTEKPPSRPLVSGKDYRWIVAQP